jgi:hypothetical protein
MKIEDTQPNSMILLPYGMKLELGKIYGYSREAIKKYIGGAAITPESKARAKEVREYALNHLNGQYFTPKQLPTPQKKKKQ